MTDNAAIRMLQNRLLRFDEIRTEHQEELDAARRYVANLEAQSHKRTQEENDIRDAIERLEVDIHTLEPTA